MTKTIITYTYRGQVERGTATERNPRLGYRWYAGYTEDPATAPWMTYRECQADAKARNASARFVR